MAPNVIWENTVDEGERRLKRGVLGLSATALVAGLDIAFGILGSDHVQGVLTPAVGPDVAHEIGGLFFGIAFVFIAIGRSELFTENFLVPVTAVFSGRSNAWHLIRLWAIAMVFNFVGLLVMGFLLMSTGMLKPPALGAAGEIATTYAMRPFWASVASGIVGGALVTLMTWLLLAADSSIARILIALITGFLLDIASMNHIIVAFGHLTFGMWAGTTEATVGDVAGNTAIALVANLLGGFVFVFFTRLFQVRGEPISGEFKPQRNQDRQDSGDLGEGVYDIDPKGEAKRGGDGDGRGKNVEREGTERETAER